MKNRQSIWTVKEKQLSLKLRAEERSKMVTHASLSPCCRLGKSVTATPQLGQCKAPYHNQKIKLHLSKPAPLQPLVPRRHWERREAGTSLCLKLGMAVQ
jgi:hypothetical protein